MKRVRRLQRLDTRGKALNSHPALAFKWAFGGASGIGQSLRKSGLSDL